MGFEKLQVHVSRSDKFLNFWFDLIDGETPLNNSILVRAAVMEGRSHPMQFLQVKKKLVKSLFFVLPKSKYMT